MTRSGNDEPRAPYTRETRVEQRERGQVTGHIPSGTRGIRTHDALLAMADLLIVRAREGATPEELCAVFDVNPDVAQALLVYLEHGLGLAEQSQGRYYIRLARAGQRASISCGESEHSSSRLFGSSETD
jgi:hypothetical protein